MASGFNGHIFWVIHFALSFMLRVVVDTCIGCLQLLDWVSFLQYSPCSILLQSHYTQEVVLPPETSDISVYSSHPLTPLLSLCTLSVFNGADFHGPRGQGNSWYTEMMGQFLVGTTASVPAWGFGGGEGSLPSRAALQLSFGAADKREQGTGWGFTALLAPGCPFLWGPLPLFSTQLNSKHTPMSDFHFSWKLPVALIFYGMKVVLPVPVVIWQDAFLQLHLALRYLS